MSEYKANFLWPYDVKSIEEAGYEFANGETEEYQKEWWDELLKYLAQSTTVEEPCPYCKGFVKSIGHNYCANCRRELPDARLYKREV